jgi:exo-beta-1,3-glucanase (GH17 family)
MKLPIALFLCSVAIIVATWRWLGAPVPMPPPPLGQGEKFQCVSYAPFRRGQTPLDVNLHVEAAQIEEDLTRLARVTECVRTYSIDRGLDQIAGIAQRHGLKVLQGLWLSNDPEKNRYQIDTTIALANRYPDVIRAVVVGNEVLLRGEISANDLGNIIRRVRAAVPVPVTYADVWEFWLRNRDLASAVDFITIHILPYWEDVPIAATNAAAHVESIRAKVAAAFPGKEILIGEVGWPSAGRMREGALPSPSNQARVLEEVLIQARQKNYRVNLIEAFDQPWKRQLEGTVGGHWGLLDADSREPKFTWGEPVSNHPYWAWAAGGGVALASLVFAVAMAARRRSEKAELPAAVWLAVSANALVSGIPIGWAVATVPVESLGIGGWIRSLALVALALAGPLVATAALVRGMAVPVFSRVIGPRAERSSDPLALVLGAVLLGVMLLSVQTALGFVFDPRYRDFPFAPLTAATIPYLVLTLAGRRGEGARGAAEIVAAATLALSALFMMINEAFANWQAVWLAAIFLAGAFTLARSRDAQSS